MSKTALESLLADKAVMADIQRLGMVPRGALGLRTAPLDCLRNKVDAQAIDDARKL